MLAITAGSLAAGSAAMAQVDELRWLVEAAPPDYASLLYALPESDFIALGFDCIGGREGIGISFDFRPIGATEGMMYTLELRSAAGSVIVEATGHTVELSGAYILSGIVGIDEPLFSVLSAGDALTIAVGEEFQAFPLPDVEALSTFATGCQAIAV
jgi:hypothetical protein